MASNIPTFKIAFSVNHDSSNTTFTEANESELKKVRDSVSSGNHSVKCELEVTFSSGATTKYTTKPIKLERKGSFAYAFPPKARNQQAVIAFSLFLNKLNESEGQHQLQPKTDISSQKGKSLSALTKETANSDDKPVSNTERQITPPAVSMCNRYSPEFHHTDYDVFRCYFHKLVDDIKEDDFFAYLQSYEGRVDFFEKNMMAVDENDCLTDHQKSCFLQFTTSLMQSQMSSNLSRKQNKEILGKERVVFIPFPIPISVYTARLILKQNAKIPPESATKKAMQDNLDCVAVLSNYLTAQLSEGDYDTETAFQIAQTLCWNFKFLELSDFESVLKEHPDYRYIFASKEANETDYITVFDAVKSIGKQAYYMNLLWDINAPIQDCSDRMERIRSKEERIRKK